MTKAHTRTHAETAGSDLIQSSTVSSVQVITLNRPEKLNAFGEPMHKNLLDELQKAEVNDDVRAILLTGAGRGFCAGQDLGERKAESPDEKVDLGETIEKFYNPIIRQIRNMPKPIICAVNGIAAGAGANLALSCDIVVAAKSSKFIQPFCKIGLLPDSGGTWLLPALVGEARAKAISLLGTVVSAELAVQWGMIWDVAEDDKLMDTAMGLANDLALGSSTSNALIKRAIHSSSGHSLDEHLDLERDLQRAAGFAPDYSEGVSAFLEKRKPNFAPLKSDSSDT